MSGGRSVRRAVLEHAYDGGPGHTGCPPNGRRTSPNGRPRRPFGQWRLPHMRLREPADFAQAHSRRRLGVPRRRRNAASEPRLGADFAGTGTARAVDGATSRAGALRDQPSGRCAGFDGAHSCASSFWIGKHRFAWCTPARCVAQSDSATRAGRCAWSGPRACRGGRFTVSDANRPERPVARATSGARPG
jgi:hypothetical protein